ncbi:MAG: hypothetical protein SFV51_05665 [Bryobacteraceae bacterium]|nr:hypothetical protein [Bryobacteraceae bacterium]
MPRFLACLVLPSALLWGQTINTIAGTGTAGFSGDNGPATEAAFNNPVYLAIDAAGNLIVADWRNHRVRRIDALGVVTTIAGTGAAGFSGDGGPATQATLNGAIGVCIDPAGNIYVNDDFNNRIRRIAPNGTITTFAGNGARVHGGDGGPATSASFNIGLRCASDSTGNIYVAEQGAHRIRRISTSGAITTIAGTGAQGFSGDGGPATAAALNNPTALTVDRNGDIYFSDQYNHRIRRISTAGTITTVAGTGTPGFSGDGGPATSANLNFPGAMVTDSNGDLYFTDGPNWRVRKINAAGVISTVAGNGARGFAGDGGPPLSASFNGEFGIALDAQGNLYIADTDNHRVRKISNVTAGAAPEFTSASVSALGSLTSGITPGALISITGRNLAPGANGQVTAPQFPLPGRLAGASVTFDGVEGAMLSVRNAGGQEQIIVQAPFELAASTTAVVVDNGRAASAPVDVAVVAAQPGILTLDGVHAAAVRADGVLISSANPAVAGEPVILFARALGMVDPIPAPGNPAPAEPLSQTATQPELTINGQAAAISFAGLAPGFVGLYQINATVPAGISGVSEVVLSIGGTGSAPVRLPVR